MEYKACTIGLEADNFVLSHLEAVLDSAFYSIEREAGTSKVGILRASNAK